MSNPVPEAVSQVLLCNKHPQLHVLKQSPQVLLLLTKIRDANSSPQDFVFYADRLHRLLAECALDLLPVTPVVAKTPTGATFTGVKEDKEHGICGVSILRAGEAFEQALRDTCRAVRIGKILIQRDPQTHKPDPQYNYSKMPPDVSQRWILLCDPMLATGGSAACAVELLLSKYNVPEHRIIFVNVVACPEGIDFFCTKFPKIRVVTAVVDEKLNENKYIIPGVGDYGDRYFGTE